MRVVKQKLVGYFLTKDQSPVCLHAGALGEGIPMRDLYVSACHSVKVDEYLVDARLLVNGVTITQQTRTGLIESPHIGLGTHHCIVAEGA